MTEQLRVHHNANAEDHSEDYQSNLNSAFFTLGMLNFKALFFF